VPTPIDEHKQPDLTPLIKASETVGKVLKAGDIVIYESTVYPGCTEEDCVPVLEKFSGLKFNHDFFCGYSPERINPGDKEHRVTTIKKVTVGLHPCGGRLGGRALQPDHHRGHSQGQQHQGGRGRQGD
jgi:UDP-N-acetyl-D-galactosamine dehydrogenase